MEKVTLGGKVYQKASVLARNLGYTTDYIGQLCRAGKVDAQLVGRSWYVTAKSLEEHKITRYRSSKATSQRAFKKNVAVNTVGEEATWSHYTRSTVTPATYNTDEADLIPTPRKVSELSDAYTLAINRVDVQKERAKALTRNAENVHIRKVERPEITKVHKTISSFPYKKRTTPKTSISLKKRSSRMSKKVFSRDPNSSVRVPRTGGTAPMQVALFGVLCVVSIITVLGLSSELVVTGDTLSAHYSFMPTITDILSHIP